MMNFNLENLSEIIDDVLREFCVTYPIPNFDNKAQLEHLRSVLEQFGAATLTDIELMEAISLAPKKFSLEATAKPEDKVKTDAHKKGLEGKGGNAYGPAGRDIITYRNQDGKLVPVTPPVKVGQADKTTPTQTTPTKKIVAPTPKKPQPKATPAQIAQVKQLQKTVDAKKDKEKTQTQTQQPKEVDVNKGTVVAPPKSRYGTKGSKEVDQQKATNRLKYLPKSKVTPEQAAENFKKKYPKALTTKYEFPKTSDALLKSKLPPAGYEALKSIMKMSKQGEYEPAISIITDQYGAGKISAQANELAMQAAFCFPPTEQGITARTEFLNSLLKNATDIEAAGGVPILDKSWIKEMTGAHDAFITNMNTKYGKNNWEVTGATWDVRAQQEALGIDYNSKGESTDMNAQIKVGGKIYNEEISCKKDWAIFLLNAGLGDASNWYYTLGEETEKRANELARLAEAKDPRFGKKELEELRSLNQKAISKAPVSNKELQNAQMKSAEDGCLSMKEIPSNEINKVLKDCLGRKKNDPLYMDQNEANLAKQVSQYLSKTQTIDVNELAKFVGGGAKNFKKSVMVYHKMMGVYQGGDKWLDTHKQITYAFIEQSAKKMATNKEFQGMLLKKLQEAIPVRALVEGVENMQIDSMYVTQKHMQEMFGTTNWDDVREFLSIKVTNGVAALVYSAAAGKAKPLKIANIQMREKGVGYNGAVALECTPAKEFQTSCKEIDTKINNRGTSK